MKNKVFEDTNNVVLFLLISISLILTVFSFFILGYQAGYSTVAKQYEQQFNTINNACGDLGFIEFNDVYDENGKFYERYITCAEI